MKILEKIALVIYSYIILAISIVTSLIIFKWLDVELVGNMIMSLLNGKTSSAIILTLNAIFLLLSIKCIFFKTSNKKQTGEEQGVLLQNENGKLMISKETIETLVNKIISQFESIEDATSNISLNTENKLIINLNLTVGENAVIKELSANVQDKIKTTIKSTLDLEAQEVNIRVKNYGTKKENNVQ